jgi:hypothetical protein
MDDRAKYRAEIDAKLLKFGETLNEIKAKRELRNMSRPVLQVDSALRKHQEAQTKAKELENANAESWEKMRTDMDTIMSDIDKDLREALAYYK